MCDPFFRAGEERVVLFMSHRVSEMATITGRADRRGVPFNGIYEIYRESP